MPNQRREKEYEDLSFVFQQIKKVSNSHNAVAKGRR